VARRDEDSLAAILLTTRLVDTAVPPLGASEYWRLHGAVPAPGRLLGADPDLAALLAPTGLDPARIRALLDRATTVALALERLETAGITVVTVFDAGYPPALTTRLGPKAPAVLHVVGDASLMAVDLLGVAGSREVSEVSEEGAVVAADAARAAVAHGWGVITGGTRGVDRLTLTAATEAGGRAVAVLADPLARVVQEPELRRIVAAGGLCLVTPFVPTARFTEVNAAARAKLIYGLARRTFVVAAELETGVTWAGATEALHASRPVDVWTGPGSGPGAQALIGLGGRAIVRIPTVFDESTTDASDAAVPTD
jgi:predicted Rossmann fold nucleotide-binding protein DprA/Smf involved in DNA uptake